MKNEAPVLEAVRLGSRVRAGVVRDLKRQLDGVDTVLMARLERVPTRQLNALRQSLETHKAAFLVVKNSLAKLTFRDLGMSALEKNLQGTCGISPVRGDVASACKLLNQFSNENEGFALRGGILKGQLLEAADLVALAKLPSRQVLLGRLAGVAQSPIGTLAFLLAAPLRSLAMTLEALGQKKEKSS